MIFVAEEAAVHGRSRLRIQNKKNLSRTDAYQAHNLK